MSESPYQPPRSQVAPPQMPEFSSRKVEAEIRYFGAFLLLLSVIPLFGTYAILTEDPSFSAVIIGVLALIPVLTGISLVCRFRFGRFLGIAACCIGVVLFPIGTIICYNPLKTLLSREGKEVFGNEYTAWLKTADVRPNLPVDTVFTLLILVVLGLYGWGIFDAITA